jgi:hypothetical protein
MSRIYFFEGRGFYDFRDPKKSVFELTDLVTACSRICRFNGHTNCDTSVLNHSLIVEKILAEQEMNPGIRLAGLVHDLHEGLVGDLPSPLKPFLSEWKEIEGEAMELTHCHIERTFGITYPKHWQLSEVWNADRRSCMTEARDYMKVDISQWGWTLEPLKDPLPFPNHPLQQIIDFNQIFATLVTEVRSLANGS